MSMLLTQSLIVATALIPQAAVAASAPLIPAQSIGAFLDVAALDRADTLRLTDSAKASRIPTRHAPGSESRLQNARKSKGWLPWVGAAVGGTAFGIAVADEGDLVFTGKLMWIGVGAAIGAGAGWVIGKIADP